MFTSYALITIIAILVGMLIYTNSKAFDKVQEQRAKKKEAKDREENPNYWKAYDYMMECAKEHNVAYKKVKSLKEQIDKTIAELDYLPEEEAKRTRETKLYNLRKSYFYAKGKLALAKEKLDKAREIHNTERAKRKSK